MEILNIIEAQIKSHIDLDKLKSEIERYFKYAFENEENNDIKADLLDVLGGHHYKCEFSGITIHLLNRDLKQPFMRAKIDIVNEKNGTPIAWYELKYGINGEILDDYFDLVI